MNDKVNIPVKREDTQIGASINKIIIYGNGGCGKTTSTVSILKDAPKERRLIYLMTERNSLGGIKFGLEKHGIDLKPGQLIYVFPQEKKRKVFTDLERSIGNYTTQSKVTALQGNSMSTEGRENYTYLLKIIKLLGSFTGTDYATGESVTIGDVGELTPNDVLIIDGLSPLGAEIWNSMVGDKIAVSQNDYMPVQRTLYGVLSALAKLDCHVIMLAHDREHYIDNGNTLEMIKVNTWCGVSNYETIMGLFTDVIYAYANGTMYKWAGKKPKVHTVVRTLPPKDGLEPDFSKYNFFNQ